MREKFCQKKFSDNIFSADHRHTKKEIILQMRIFVNRKMFARYLFGQPLPYYYKVNTITITCFEFYILEYDSITKSLVLYEDKSKAVNKNF